MLRNLPYRQTRTVLIEHDVFVVMHEMTPNFASMWIDNNLCSTSVVANLLTILEKVFKFIKFSYTI